MWGCWPAFFPNFWVGSGGSPPKILPYLEEFHVKFHVHQEFLKSKNLFGFPTPKIGRGQGHTPPPPPLPPLENVTGSLQLQGCPTPASLGGEGWEGGGQGGAGLPPSPPPPPPPREPGETYSTEIGCLVAELCPAAACRQHANSWQNPAACSKPLLLLTQEAEWSSSRA